MNYGPDPRQRYWIHPDSKPNGKWLIIIHGGLWRDPTVTEKSGVKLANDVKKYFNGIASVDYRLSPQVTHPQHMNDCCTAIQEIISQYSPQQLVFIGHSAGCYIAGQIAPEFKPSLVIGLEGLYDLDDLVEEYPSLEPMIKMAFPGVWLESRPDWANVPLAIIHSTQDELVSMRQPEFVMKLCPVLKLVVDANGTHNFVFEESDLADRVGECLSVLEEGS